MISPSSLWLLGASLVVAPFLVHLLRTAEYPHVRPVRDQLAWLLLVTASTVVPIGTLVVVKPMTPDEAGELDIETVVTFQDFTSLTSLSASARVPLASS